MPKQDIERLLARQIGLDPGTVGDGLIVRALHARMSDLGIASQDEYLRLLVATPDEQQELIEEVVVSESWFLRDKHPFTFLRDSVSDRAPTAFRILSIPCAGGEEPYSIAITLREAGLPFARFRIDAVDVSSRALECARRGLYSENALRGTDDAFRLSYFQKRPGGFELDGAIRASVRFLHGNLLDPRLLSDEPPYDAIFCRNVLIYFDPGARARALANLDRLLGPDGLLFLGHAELPGGSVYESCGTKGAFAYRRVAREPARIEPPQTPRRPARPRAKPSTDRNNARSASDSAALSAAPLRPEQVRALSPSTLLAQASALADQGRNEQAALLCEQALHAGPNAPAFFLLGLIRQATGAIKEAEECFQKTVYLDPTHDEALLALALCAERRGDAIAAAGYRRRANRAHAKQKQRRETP